jgi:hypothetical protein
VIGAIDRSIAQRASYMRPAEVYETKAQSV